LLTVNLFDGLLLVPSLKKMSFQSNLCQDHWSPFATSVTTAIVAGILTLVTAPGNSLICWAVVKNPTGNLKTSFNYLVLNLAIADLIIGAVTDPLFVGYHVIEALRNEVSLKILWVLHVSYFLTSTASVLSIVALAVNRYQAVKTDRIQRCKLSSIAATSVLLWVFSVGFTLLYFAVGFYKMAFIFTNASLVIVTAVLIFIYFRVYYSLKWHRKTSAQIRSSRQQEIQTKRNEKVTNSLLLIIISFVLCVLPSCVMVYVINVCRNCNCVLVHWFRDLQCLLLLVNAALNQFLYAWRMRSFQRAFKTITAVQWFAKKAARAKIGPVRTIALQTAYAASRKRRRSSSVFLVHVRSASAISTEDQFLSGITATPAVFGHCQTNTVQLHDNCMN